MGQNPKHGAVQADQNHHPEVSDTTMSKEFEAARDTFGLSLEDFEKIIINAMKSAFLPYDQRCDFIYSAIKPAYAKVGNSQATK
jgi:adenosine deaminase